MSLFGSSPDESFGASKLRNSLFDEGASHTPVSKSSIITYGDSPVSSHRRSISPDQVSSSKFVKRLIPSSAIPNRYVEIFESISQEDVSFNRKIDAAGIAKTFACSMLDKEVEQLILEILYAGNQTTSLNRNEYSVLLALIGFAQERREISLDNVNQNIQNLPVPKISSLPKGSPIFQDIDNSIMRLLEQPNTFSSDSHMLSRRESMDDMPDTDPWRSLPATQGNEYCSKLSETSRERKKDTETNAGNNFLNQTFSGESTAKFDNQLHDTNSVGSSAWVSGSNPVSRIAGARLSIVEDSSTKPPEDNHETSNRTEEAVVSTLPEKEGIFMFQHRNYQISSTRKGLKVVRRFSDFVWLVGVNGNHLAADNTFIEKRRRGLARFINALTSHPVLSQEQLVVMFLTVPTELSVWRKQASISIQDEFIGRELPSGLEDSLPQSLNELFDRARNGIRRSADIYTNLCILLDRLAKRNEGLAADQLRISLSLRSLSDLSADTYATDTSGILHINESLRASAKHLSDGQILLIDEARAWDQGVVEDLKKQRDSLVSMRELFDRRDMYDKDNIPYLERRIQKNDKKLIEIRSKPDGEAKRLEIGKIIKAITTDKQSIVSQHDRSVFVRECIRDELINFTKSQHQIKRWNQDWAQERVKYSELHADNWKQLIADLDKLGC
ncbi:sorting nexin mvp1 [Blumeria hordei DH14]|uniref:Sorting nexin MVP1 n=1 Tax=Blumeria graminis f. sp. hordei (strain DH14) TaxID=546991 RepID=N1JBC5_BLUG1|nr:sorting nexin mvp1 [Blumeria hordei DH14]